MSKEPQQLQIEKVVYGGDGLARMPPAENGRRLTVFVPFTLPGERVSANLSKPQKFARGELVQVLEPSLERIAPTCPYFQRCGGCQLQHGQYSWQLQAKREMLAEAFSRAGIALPAEVRTISASPYGYRSRVRLHVDARGNVGYLERASHRLLAIDTCPIASPAIERAIKALRAPAVTAAVPQNVTQVELFADAAGDALLLTAICGKSPAKAPQFRLWMHALQAELPDLRGGVLQLTGTQPPQPVLATFGDAALQAAAGEHRYRVSAGAFFQGNRFLLQSLIEEVRSAVSGGPSQADGLKGMQVWDLYAGVGLFSLPLALAGANVTAVEGGTASGKDLLHNLTGTGATAHNQSVESYLSSAAAARPDCILVDPPRTGLSPEAVSALNAKRCARIVYLSCDPATLARDLRALERIYTIEAAVLIDLFPQTFHMETLVTLTLR